MIELSALTAFPPTGDYESDLDRSREAIRAASKQGLDPLPQSETFQSEMDNPLHILDDESGRTYGVYLVNGDRTGTPLVMNMSWSVPAGSKNGRSEINAYAARLDRPIIVIDTEGHGETDAMADPWQDSLLPSRRLTFDDLAAAHVRVLDKLGVEEFDLQGMSMGGVIATKMAGLAGDRVGTLATISTVGYDHRKFPRFVWQFGRLEGRHQRDYQKLAPSAVMAEVDTGFVGDLRRWRTLLRLATMMAKEVIPGSVEDLSPSTKWYDFVGSAEEVTDWRTHRDAVRNRNASHHGSSSLHVLGGETHAWSSLYISHIAEFVTTALKRERKPAPATSRKVMMHAGRVDREIPGWLIGKWPGLPA